MNCKAKFIAIALVGIMSVVPIKIQAEIETQKSLEIHPSNKKGPFFIEASVRCLALNMYYEARSQGTAGLFAVTAVVLNRVNDPRFPNTVCKVVYQGPTRESWKTRQHKDLPASERKYYPIKNRCQFSWYCDGKNDNPHNKKRYRELLDLSEAILYNEIPFIDITDGALFYHADYVTPRWVKTKQRTAKIEDHIFYRWDTQ